MYLNPVPFHPPKLSCDERAGLVTPIFFHSVCQSVMSPIHPGRCLSFLCLTAHLACCKSSSQHDLHYSSGKEQNEPIEAFLCSGANSSASASAALIFTYHSFRTIFFFTTGILSFFLLELSAFLSCLYVFLCV